MDKPIKRNNSNILKIDKISPEKKKQLNELAIKKYGTGNISFLVRELIDSSLRQNGYSIDSELEDCDLSGDSKGIRIYLPVGVVDKIEEKSEKRLSSRTQFIRNLIISGLGKKQLQGDEIEVLRSSNYELSKIGTNLNQIARAFNILASAGEGGKLPEIGKRIAALNIEIRTHIKRVLSVLESGTVTWEGAKRGGRKKSRTGAGKR